MTPESDDHVKVLFRYHSPVKDELSVETMWAIKVDEKKGIFRLDSIPFYGPPIAPNDEFFAEYDNDEERLTFRYVTNSSEYSVVLVIITKEGLDKERIRNEFKALDCTSEGFGDTYFSMEFPKEVDYSSIKPLLESYMSDGLLDYCEPVLSVKHQKDLSKQNTTISKGQSGILGKFKSWLSR